MKILFRNAPCPCGSGRKFKRCHGIEMPKANLRKNEIYFPSLLQPIPSHAISRWIAEPMKSVSRQ